MFPREGTWRRGLKRGKRALCSLNKLKVQIKLTCSICAQPVLPWVGGALTLTWEALGTVLGTIATVELVLASVHGPCSVILLIILAAGHKWLMSSLEQV